MKSVNELVKGDILINTNHGFEIKITEIGKKNTRYINLETGEKVKSFTRKFNFMLREGVFNLVSEIKNMTSATFTSKDNNWADNTTVYWFELGGEDWGVSDCGGDEVIVDCDGCPINTGDARNAHLPSELIVTDEMRAL